MTTAREIINIVGSKWAQERLKVGDKSISAAITAGSFPASWYRVLRDECSLKGKKCPVELFNFRLSEEEEGK